MYTEKLGISPEQQSYVDGIFIDTALEALNQKPNYWDRAALVCTGGQLADELEAIRRRTYEAAHEALLSAGEIGQNVLGNMGKIDFIDALELPSSQRLDDKVIAVRALGDYTHMRRLFADPPPPPKPKEPGIMSRLSKSKTSQQ
jgi:hypothetical protein